MQVIGLLFIGLVIGALARLIKPGRQRIGLLMTLVLGVAGALIGGLIATFIGTGTIWELDFLGFVFAVIAAVVLVGLAEGTAGRKTHA